MPESSEHDGVGRRLLPEAPAIAADAQKPAVRPVTEDPPEPEGERPPSFQALGYPDDRDVPELPPDLLFEVLKNHRRRLVLEYLRDAEEPVEIGSLAEHIAAIENDVSPQELNAQQRKRVYIGLYQCHLPKMADADVVEFNQPRGIIEVGEHAAELYPFIDAERELPTVALRPYLLIVVAGALTFLLSRLYFPVWTGNLVVLAVVAAVLLAVVR